MSITLIVTRTYSRDFEETGKTISLDEWLALVQKDPNLAIRTDPFVTTNPRDKSEITMAAGIGQTELITNGRRVPFLRHAQGELLMQLHPDFENPENPVRKKIVEIAQMLDAQIMHDAAGEFLDW